MTAPSSLGKIEVSRRALASVIAGAVASCYGVVGMAPRSLRDQLDDLLGRQRPGRGIAIQLVDGRLIIDLYIIVEYGVPIVEVGRNVAEAVRFAVERALGITVAHVNVNVEGLRVSDRS